MRAINLAIKISIIFVFLSACSNNLYVAPVSDFSQPPSKKIKTHQVAQGETLYSIAWRYSLDYKKLAIANNLSPQFTIFPGQKLNLDIANIVVPKVKKASSRATPKKIPVVSQASPAKDERSINTTKITTQNAVTKPNLTPKDWVWPSEGKIIATFSSNNGLHKGIDLDGDLGEPVRAAAGGTVVYSGDGLRGYGKLIIVKHSEKYLSAYAHNQKLMVVEGDIVTMGQKIAEMGSTGTDSVKLHFEIRYDGKPVNPVTYLPKR